MAESSRRGKKIARRACDACRDRRVQCAFDGEGSSSCRQCERSGISCTFLTDRKPRGPPRRRGNGNAQHARVDEASPGPAQLPLGTVSVSHFVPESIFLTILDDFLLRVYPVLPLVHVPSFTTSLRQRAFETDPVFFRLCISLCAVTVASIPRNVAGFYGSSWYTDAGQMVERASHMVLLSRLATSPTWQNEATVDSMIVSVILAMASHYAGKPNAGWAYASEAVQFFRELELYKQDAYNAFNPIERELCKRSFWLLLIIQIHDRMSFTNPHTGLSYDPRHTDWSYLLPAEQSDDDLATNAPQSCSQAAPTPIIAGFIALIKVFVCIVDLLDKSFPGPPPYFSLSPGALATTLFPAQEIKEASFRTPADLPLLESLFQVMTRLNVILSELPEPLSLRTRDSVSSDSAGHDTAYSSQFEIMRANIHITAIYFQSLVLEMCLNKLQGDQSSTPQAQQPPELPQRSISSQLWQMKESVARELLEILSCSSASVLESNGTSMIKKIREIAATFLDHSVEGAYDSGLGKIEQRSHEYLRRFVEILAELDYVPGAT